MQSPPRPDPRPEAPLPLPAPTVGELSSHRSETSLHIFRAGYVFTVILVSDSKHVLAEEFHDGFWSSNLH